MSFYKPLQTDLLYNTIATDLDLLMRAHLEFLCHKILGHIRKFLKLPKDIELFFHVCGGLCYPAY